MHRPGPVLSAQRRDFLQALGALGLSALPRPALSDHAATFAPPHTRDFCGASGRGRPLFIPGASGLFGRLAPGGDYAATATEALNGFVGDSVLINGTACPHLDVATPGVFGALRDAIAAASQ